jgi:putative DNA primase/helicase
MGRHHVGPVSAIEDAALRHARAGRPVFPCHPATKRPLTRNGFYDASTDEGRVREWFGTPDPPMIGVRTGEASGLVALDVDSDLEAGVDGFVHLRELERAHGILPATASFVTPRGGSQFCFRHPGVRVPCSQGLLADGVDIRGDGGYSIFPPSVRADGCAYVADSQLPAAAMPEWLVELARGRHALTGIAAEEAIVPAGKRHAALVRFAGTLRAMGLGEAALLACGEAFLRHHCADPPERPIDYENARRAIRSIAKYPPQPNRRAG